jgi:hypothetical protein
MSLTSYRAAPPRGPNESASWLPYRTAQAHSSYFETSGVHGWSIFRERPGDGLLERLAAQIFGDDFAFAIQQERGGN